MNKNIRIPRESRPSTMLSLGLDGQAQTVVDGSSQALMINDRNKRIATKGRPLCRKKTPPTQGFPSTINYLSANSTTDQIADYFSLDFKLGSGR